MDHGKAREIPYLNFGVLDCKLWRIRTKLMAYNHMSWLKLYCVRRTSSDIVSLSSFREFQVYTLA